MAHRLGLGVPTVDVDPVPPGLLHQELRGRPRYGLRLGAIAGLADKVSDTTILSSTGVACSHLEHVATQLPYALFAASCSLAGFIISGIFMNPLASWTAVLTVFTAGMIFLPKVSKS